MGRRKLEIKRIEDKNRRQVTFCKRRAGLKKKARQLSVLCDVDVAVVIFSCRGKLYEYCSGGTDSAGHILCRYEEETATQQGACKETGFKSLRTCKEILGSVKRLEEDPNEFSVSEMRELEEELSHALMHTRSRKTELLMEKLSSFQEQEKILTEELKQQQQQQVEMESAKNQKDDDVDDTAANYHPTLSLFPQSNQ